MRIVLALLLLAAVPSLARADVAPPDNTCTIANGEDGGENCQSCGASYAGDPCPQMFAGTDNTLTCKTSGASAWTEIWCEAARDAGAPSEGTDAGHHLADIPSHPCGAGVPGLLSLPALGLFRRRRPRR